MIVLLYYVVCCYSLNDFQVFICHGIFPECSGWTLGSASHVLAGVMENRKGGDPCLGNGATRSQENLESSNRDYLLINRYDEKSKIKKSS